MIQIVIAALLFLLTVWAVRHTVQKAKKGGGCCGDREETVPRRRVEDKNRSHYPYRTKLMIGGMTCENCARKAENALNSLPGTWARVNIASKTAEVLSKETPDPEKFRECVTAAGYVVLEIREPE